MHQALPDISLLTDFYQYTMAKSYFDVKRQNDHAVFHIFFRKNPFAGNWALAAGIDDALALAQNFSIGKETTDYLSSLTTNGSPIFHDEFLQFLLRDKPTISIDGVTDGDVVFPYEPMLRIEGPIYFCQMLETPLLNIINFHTLIATKAARIVLAARGKPIIDFGLRRAQGFDGAMSATKASIIGGIVGTSNVLAAKKFGIAPVGTQAHSFIMSYHDEKQAFNDFADSCKNNPFLLVDTYDPLQGIAHAIATLKRSDVRGGGIRLDSGDLLHLSRTARAMFDAAGLNHCKIVASGDLDEHSIQYLESNDAPIDCYGVGTKLITAYDDAALSGVYKLAAIHSNGKVRATEKLCSDKISLPGAQTLTRFFHDGVAQFDAITHPHVVKHQENFQAESMHHSLMRNQKSTLPKTTLQEKARRGQASLNTLPKSVLHLKKAAPYPVYFDDGLNETLNLSRRL